MDCVLYGFQFAASAVVLALSVAMQPHPQHPQPTDATLVLFWLVSVVVLVIATLGTIGIKEGMLGVCVLTSMLTGSVGFGILMAAIVYCNDGECDGDKTLWAAVGGVVLALCCMVSSYFNLTKSDKSNSLHA